MTGRSMPLCQCGRCPMLDFARRIDDPGTVLPPAPERPIRGPHWTDLRLLIEAAMGVAILATASYVALVLT